MQLSNLENKKIVILGLGKEGMDNFEFLRKLFPNKILGLADEAELEKLSSKTKLKIKKDTKIKTHFGKACLKSLFQYDVIFKTPGIPLRKLRPFLKKRQKVTSQTQIFFENSPGLIVGVTGTKGKGTTTSIIYEILKKAGKSAALIGNIGTPVLSFLLPENRKDVFVYELSSHQLQNLRKSPKIAIFLNLYQAHLDYYKTFKEYTRAKENIALFQNQDDYFVYNKDQEFLRKLSGKTKAQKLTFGLESKNLDCYTKNGWIFYKKEKILKESEIPLTGRFYLYNIMAAVISTKLLGVSSATIRKAVKGFKPLLHRLEFVGKFRGIEFYNDSLATIPEATILGIQTFKDKLGTLILGGYDAKQNFKTLARAILKTGIENLIFFPTTGQRIWKEILKENKVSKKNFENLKPYFVDNMKNAISIAFSQTRKGRVCLLSCACPSFGVFKDYKERGELFKKFVKLYGKKRI